MLGREVSLPDQLFSFNKLSMDIPSYLKNLQSELDRAQNVARSNLKQAQLHQKDIYDGKLRF